MATPRQPRTTRDLGDTENHPPWPEWSDSYINSTQWGRIGIGKRSLVFSPSMIKAKGLATVTPESSEEGYEDPAGLVELPPDVPVSAWKRPCQIDPNINYVVQPDSTPLNLLDINKHLLDYKIMKVIISSVTCLERESWHRPFPIEFQSEQFTAIGGVEWKPWHHVYALTMAGKGQTHAPQYNPYGKYIIRIFFMGKWRRIVVDDLLPVDDNDQILLPMSRPDNLWFPLLSKALLRIAALSWQPSNHCVDFSVVHCLTGWIQTIVHCKGCSPYQVWCVCCQLMPTTEEIVSAPGCCRIDGSLISFEDDSVAGLSAVASRAIIAVIGQPPPYDVKKNPALPTNFEQRVLISNVRYNSEQPTPLWKQYRWNEWAYNKGIISEIPFQPVRNVQIYNPLEVYPEQSVEINDSVKNEVWFDFDVFAPVVRHFEVYYKPSYFKYSFRGWAPQDLLLPPHVADDVIIRSRERSSVKGKGGGEAKSTTKPKSAKTEKPEKSTNVSSKTASTKGTEKIKGGRGRANSNKDKIEEDLPPNMLQPSFFYLLTDSLVSKEMLVCLSAYDPERPTYAHIFIGWFTWHSPSVAPLIERISTNATSAQFFTPPPGLRVFRIWYQFPAIFCLQILSNTQFQCGLKMTIQQSLTGDSLSYKYFGKEISSSFEQLLGAPQGGADHGKAFQQLTSSIHPPQLTSQLAWPQWFNVHSELWEAFEESLTEMLVESLHHPEEFYQTIKAFQLLLLNPVFGENALKTIKIEYYDYVIKQKELEREKEILLEEEMNQKLAQAIEEKSSKKKGAKSEKSKKSKEKSPSSPTTEANLSSPKTAKTKEKAGKKGKEKPIPVSKGEQLRKLLQCKEKNLLISDPNQAIILLKKIMSKLPHLRHLYPFNYEDDIKMVYQDYAGELHVNENWVVLARCVLNIHASEAVPCSLHVWSPVESLVLRLIDNDTGEDILPLGIVENNVSYLTRNAAGYTVLAYGVAVSQTVPWRVRSMGVREADCLHVCHGDSCIDTHIQPIQQYQQTLKGFYLPNKANVIASYLIEVYSDVTVLLRMQLSYKCALCSLTITDDAGDVIVSTSGIGYIMIPALHLKGKEISQNLSWENLLTDTTENESVESKPCVYRVTAKIVENSWPLSQDQIIAMLYYKEHLPDIQIIHTQNTFRESSSVSERHSSPNPSFRGTADDPEFTFFQSVEKPSWTATLVTDLVKEVSVNLRLDTTLLDTINELKKQWELEGFDLARCKTLRRDFLTQLSEEEELSEKAVFHLEPIKLNKLTQLYGRKISSDWFEEDEPAGCSIVSPVYSKSASTVMSELTLNTLSEKKPSTVVSVKPSEPSLDPSALKSTSSSVETEEKVDHNNVLVQQAGIHQALENMRKKTLDHIQEVFTETANLRAQLLNEMKMAKEAESKTDKSKPDDQKDKKGRKSSPTETKGKKTSLKDSKKPKAGKGKAK